MLLVYTRMLVVCTRMLLVCTRVVFSHDQASVMRMPAPNMFDTAVQASKTSPVKHENKRNVLSCLIECLMAFKFYQTRWPNGKMFGRQTMFDGRG